MPDSDKIYVSTTRASKTPFPGGVEKTIAQAKAANELWFEGHVAEVAAVYTSE